MFIGMIVLPDLGLMVCTSNDEPLIVSESSEVTIANVRLLQFNVVPSLKGQYLRAKLVYSSNGFDKFKEKPCLSLT